MGFHTTYRPPDSRAGVEDDVFYGRDGLHGWHETTRQPQPLDHRAPYSAWIYIPTKEEQQGHLRYRRATTQDVALYPEDVPEGFKGKRGMGSLKGMYRVKDEVFAELESASKALLKDVRRASRLLRRAAGMKMGDLNSKSVVRTVVNDLIFPWREVLDVTLSCALLRWGCLGSYQEFDICWTAHQRACWYCLAYVHFVGDMLPRGFAPGLEQRAALIPKTSQRGSILAGSDIDTYFKFLWRLGVPFWVCVEIKEFDVPKDLFGPADASRCDVIDFSPLSKSDFFISRCAMLI